MTYAITMLAAHRKLSYITTIMVNYIKQITCISPMQLPCINSAFFYVSVQQKYMLGHYQ